MKSQNSKKNRKKIKSHNSKFQIEVKTISKSKIQNPKSKPINLVQRLYLEKSENISSRDYVQKNLKTSRRETMSRKI